MKSLFVCEELAFKHRIKIPTEKRIFKQGDIVMGIDRSYTRSFYEVVAVDYDHKLFVLLMRYFKGSVTIEEQFDEPLAVDLHVAPMEQYAIETDHLLKPSWDRLKIIQSPKSWSDPDGEWNFNLDGTILPQKTLRMSTKF